MRKLESVALVETHREQQIEQRARKQPVYMQKQVQAGYKPAKTEILTKKCLEPGSPILQAGLQSVPK